ncbi:rod shape-determining protein [Psychrobacter aestuarii]|uniref:Cell shape-determining protein MreB n=1 Tax=Psychrobacter aestuarii TaxID=556327 RepID=A0ABP3FJQ3_9GAMM|nr:rod shape-determining protein [Psychrobacter aestuarii]
MNVFGLLANNIAIDLGTANTLIFIPNKGVVLDEPTIVALRSNRMERPTVAAIGHDAKAMLGRTPADISAIRPLKDGVIADFEVTEELLKRFMHKVNAKRWFLQPQVVVCVPCRSTLFERQGIRKALLSAGASNVLMLEEPMAAALGAGLPVHHASGSMIVDIGGGTTEVAIIALSGCVYSASVRVGGDMLDDAIITHVRRTHGCIIGEPTAEYIKHKIGCAQPPTEDEAAETEIEVHGRSIAQGVPKTVHLTAREVQEALHEPLNSIVSAVKSALEQTPPELSADLAKYGIVLTGGGALLRHMDGLLSKATGLPVIVAPDPLTCVARGGGKALDFIHDKRLSSIFV